MSTATDRMAAGNGVVLGVDLGGTKVIAGLATLDGSTIASEEQPTRHGGATPVLDQIVEITRGLCARQGLAASGLIHATIGVPGSVNPQSGLVSLAPNVSLPTDRPLAPLFEAALGCPVDLENDVNIAAFGESTERPEIGSLAFLSFGTGVGLGIVIEGRILRGAQGAAGEIAFMPFGADPYANAAAAPGGAYEEIVGSAGIRARHGEADVSVIEIFARAEAGDRRAMDAIAATVRDAAVGIAAVQAIVDPEMVVLGGSIGARPDFAAAVAEAAARLLPSPVRIETSRLGRLAGIEGAKRAAVRAAVNGRG